MVKSFPVPCTKEEIDSLIAVAREEADIYGSKKHRDFFYMLFYVAKTTGRRLGEYYLLQVKDIDFVKNVMLTRVLKRRQRIIKEALLNDETSRVLKSYIARHALKLEDYLFRAVSYRQIQKTVEEYAKKAKIPHSVSFHNFRHYFITSLVKQGWSYDKITKLTGHSNAGSLHFYDHSVATDIKEDAMRAIQKL